MERREVEVRRVHEELEALEELPDPPDPLEIKERREFRDQWGRRVQQEFRDYQPPLVRRLRAQQGLLRKR